jgi:hypothetical protein
MTISSRQLKVLAAERLSSALDNPADPGGFIWWGFKGFSSRARSETTPRRNEGEALPCVAGGEGEPTW